VCDSMSVCWFLSLCLCLPLSVSICMYIMCLSLSCFSLYLRLSLSLIHHYHPKWDNAIDIYFKIWLNKMLKHKIYTIILALVLKKIFIYIFSLDLSKYLDKSEVDFVPFLCCTHTVVYFQILTNVQKLQ